MSVMLKRSESETLCASWCGCCGPLTVHARRREVVKLRRSIRHAEKMKWRKMTAHD